MSITLAYSSTLGASLLHAKDWHFKPFLCYNVVSQTCKTVHEHNFGYCAGCTPVYA